MTNVKARAKAFVPQLKSIANIVGLASIAGLYAYGIKTQVDLLFNQMLLTSQSRHPQLSKTIDGLYITLIQRGRVKEANALKRCFAFAPTSDQLRALIAKYEQEFEDYFRRIAIVRNMGDVMEKRFTTVMDIAAYLVRQKRYVESTKLTELLANKPDSDELLESIVSYSDEISKAAGAPRKQPLIPDQYPAELRKCVDKYNEYVAKLNRSGPMRPDPAAIQAAQKLARIECHPDKHRAHQQQANAISAMLTA